MITEERIIQLLRTGCPKCGGISFIVDSTELVRRCISLHPSTPGSIIWDKPEYIETVSEDYIICISCWWQEPEE